MRQKVIVIGLDCATFRFIKPYAEEGWLPNLKRIMAKGVSRVLKSTVPPISPPAWTTFLTGKNPGRHGIFQFVDMDVRNYSFTRNRLINSSLFSGQTFIDFISNQNLKVGIIKVPFTYPPWNVNGFMIAGEPSPDWEKAHTYPSELSDRIGRVNLGSSIDFIRYNTDELLRHLKFDCDVRTRIACEMLETEKYDFFMLVHNITDAAVHRFWKFTDSTCPNYKKHFSSYKNIIRDIYIETDKSIERILTKVDQNTTVFFMSDHGAACKPIHFFHPNAWLKEMGYLHCKDRRSSAQCVRSLLTSIKNFLPPVLRQLIVHVLQMYVLKKLSAFQTRAANFDWSETRAYAVNLYTTYDGIALNLKGRQPNGIVEPGTEAERLCNEMQSAIADIRDPRNGKKIIEKIYRRDEVFKGCFTDRMPELILQYNHNYRGGKDTESSLVTDVSPADFDFQSGDHDENGIFIACGNNIKKGIELAPAKIQDMAPTILYAMGLPVPDDMDGQVMLDIFEPDFVEKSLVKRVNGKQWTATQSYELSENESDKIREKLKGLGYM